MSAKGEIIWGQIREEFGVTKIGVPTRVGESSINLRNATVLLLDDDTAEFENKDGENTKFQVRRGDPLDTYFFSSVPGHNRRPEHLKIKIEIV